MTDMATNPTATETVQALFLQHAAALRGFIFGLVGHRDEAKDIFQEVFLTATRLADRYQQDYSFLAWARGIARNKILEHFRSCRRQPRLFDEEMLELMIACVGEQDDLWEDRRAALAECIAELTPRARQILELRYAAPPAAPPEIARRLNWTVNAVNVALSRARRFLQECTRHRLEGGVD